MDNKLYVGNLPYTMRDEDLREHFARFGEVASAKVMTDRDTGRSPRPAGVAEARTWRRAERSTAGRAGHRSRWS